MKHKLTGRLCAFALVFCLGVLPVPAAADTYLPDGEVTHTDFTMKLSLHADAFPAGKAHWSDWETFLNKVDITGTMDTLAMFTPDSRVYLDGALRLNGEEKLPFVYDGYHSYRYIISPAINNESMFFQMHNFLEFMLKPYNYMELPTQYLALLMYPEAAYWLADSYYTPVKELLESARQETLAASVGGDSMDALQSPEAGSIGIIGGADGPTAIFTSTDTEAGSIGIIGGADGPTAIFISSGTEDGLVYTVPYEDLYELCETLDLIVNDDYDLERAYYFFTCLLTELYASDMTLEILGDLETQLDAVDPDEEDMIVTETENSLACWLGDTRLFTKKTEDGVTTLTLTLPTAEGYTLSFDYRWDASGAGAALLATLSVTDDDREAVVLTAQGDGLPVEGALEGKGSLTLTASGEAFEEEPKPLMFTFAYSRTAAQKPYTLDLTVDWVHPETLLPALTMAFNGTFKTVDKSVFVEKKYPQNDFFNLNESFLEEYKERFMPTIVLKLAPFLLEMPAGVIDDIYNFTSDTDILVSFVE